MVSGNVTFWSSPLLPSLPFQGWYQKALLLFLKPQHLHCQTLAALVLPIPFSVPSLCSAFSRLHTLGLLAGLFFLEMNSLLTLTHFDVSQGSMLAGGPPGSLKKTAGLGPRLEARGDGTAKCFPFYGQAWLNLKTFQTPSQQPWSI